MGSSALKPGSIHLKKNAHANENAAESSDANDHEMSISTPEQNAPKGPKGPKGQAPDAHKPLVPVNRSASGSLDPIHGPNPSPRPFVSTHKRSVSNAQHGSGARAGARGPTNGNGNSKSNSGHYRSSSCVNSRESFDQVRFVQSPPPLYSPYPGYAVMGYPHGIPVGPGSPPTPVAAIENTPYPYHPYQWYGGYPVMVPIGYQRQLQNSPSNGPYGPYGYVGQVTPMGSPVSGTELELKHASAPQNALGGKPNVKEVEKGSGSEANCTAASLDDPLKSQLSYYLSPANLIKDFYLRNNMDANAWVPVSLLMSFPKVKRLTQDRVTVVATLRAIPSLEVSSSGDSVRPAVWEKWAKR